MSAAAQSALVQAVPKRQTRSDKVESALSMFLRELSKTVELAPEQSCTRRFSCLYEHLRTLVPDLTLNTLERVYIPLLPTTAEYGKLGIRPDYGAKTLTFTNLIPVPGPDITLFLSAIIRERESQRKIYVEGCNLQPNTDPVAHKSVFEDWSFRFPEAGPLDFHFYEKKEARLMSDDEWKTWNETRRNGKALYYQYID